MSEHIHHHQPEHIGRTPETEPEPHTAERQPHGQESVHPPEERPETQIDELRHKAEAVAHPAQEVTVEAATIHHQPQYVNQELKSQAAQRSLSRTRKKLGMADRAFSRIIHQPAVELTSEAAEKTIARPIELFTGALFALLGSSFALYMAKHYGFRYNLLLFVLLFAAGFMVGVVIDIILSLFKHHR